MLNNLRQNKKLLIFIGLVGIIILISYPVLKDIYLSNKYLFDKDAKPVILKTGNTKKVIDYNLISTKLSMFSGNSHDLSVAFSPDGRKVIHINWGNGKPLPVINGQQGNIYDSMGNSLSISPDSKKIGYSVHDPKTDKWLVIINDQDRESFYYNEAGETAFGIVFSPNSENFAYEGEKGNRQFVVVNGEKGKLYDRVSKPVFSSDNQKVVYSAQTGKKAFVVVNGKEINVYDGFIDDLTLSLSNKIAFILTKKNGKQVVVNDNQYGKEYDIIRNINFSPDGKKIFYDVGSECSFSPPSGDLTGGYNCKKYNTVVNEQELKAMGFHIISPDSQKIAQIVSRSVRTAALIVNNVEYGGYSGIGGLTFSPDSQKVGFVADKGVARTGFVVIDIGSGEKDENFSYSNLNWSSIVFSPDSQKVAYMAAGKDGKYYITVKNGKDKIRETKRYDRIWDPVFSSDSKKIMFGAAINNELWWIVDSID